MEERYLVVSDLHLSDVEDHEDGWKYFKGSRYLFDPEFASLLEQFAGESDRRVTLVLNGDIFDFDLVTAIPETPPWPVGAAERRHGLRPTAAKSAWKLGRILDHHEPFLMALVRFVAAGHRIVYVLGNHDREFHFPEVREAFLERLSRLAGDAGLAWSAERVRFEPWFFHEAGRIYVEHGHQYDYYSSFRYVLDPEVQRGGQSELALPMGNISNRLLMSRMGYFNPHTTDYILNVFLYLAHWFRYYAFSRHSLFLSWLFGSFVTLRRLLATKRRLLRGTRPYAERLTEQAERTGLSRELVVALHKLQKPPITSRVFRIIREFWIDRLIMAFLMTGGTIVLALVPIPLWIKLMVPLSCFPLVYFLYESIVQGETVFSAEEGVNRHAFPIARLLDVPVVVFGHTHAPRLRPLEPGRTMVNTGTWAPMTAQPMGELRPGYRNYVVVEHGVKGATIALGAAGPSLPPGGGGQPRT